MCRLCETKPVYEFTNKRKLCKNCFIKYFQKKVFFIVRKFGMIKHGDVVACENKMILKDKQEVLDFRIAVLKYVLKMFEEKGIIELTKEKANKIAIPSTIDLEASEIVKILIKRKEADLKKLKPVEKIKGKTIIKPLYLFLDEEVLLYAKLKGLKWQKQKDETNKIKGFLDELEKRHPEVKRAVVNSYLNLYGEK